jgi:trans-2,3-dihydro-3-hydroxyanthranilate isomerase
MPYRYHTADVFTEKPFGGNQLAVLPDARGLSAEQMQAIAREFNFSETVFVLPPENPAHTRKLRIFTPGYELPFAGHPTVGAAYVLAETGEIELEGDETEIVFEEGAGPVPVLICSRESKPYFTQLAAPHSPEKGKGAYDPRAIAAAVSLDVADLDLDGEYSIEAVSAGVPFLMVPVRSLEALGRAKIDMPSWEKHLANTWAPEPFLFTALEPPLMRARMFAPNMGIVEDPATGSACACFGGYLAWRSDVRDGVLQWTVHQGVEMGRPSIIEVEAEVTGGVVTTVRVGGASVLVSSGTLHVP